MRKSGQMRVFTCNLTHYVKNWSLFFLSNNFCKNAGTVRCTDSKTLSTYRKSNQTVRTSLQICGLTLTVDLDGLAVLYLATLQALAVSINIRYNGVFTTGELTQYLLTGKSQTEIVLIVPLIKQDRSLKWPRRERTFEVNK